MRSITLHGLYLTAGVGAIVVPVLVEFPSRERWARVTAEVCRFSRSRLAPRFRTLLPIESRHHGLLNELTNPRVFEKKLANVRAPVCRKCERVNWSSLSRVIKIFLVSIRSFVVVQFECPFVYDPKLLEKGSRGTGECDDRSSASRHEDAVLVIRQTNFRLSLPSAFPYYLSASECSALAHLH